MTPLIQINAATTKPQNCKIIWCSVRRISKYLHKDICSKTIRQKFLDYFIDENNHKFVKSSPVVPYCDPTVAFVNAGMNQFKGVFLGTQEPQYLRVANSQKCIRVGGKHNDLNVVGTDGYHHTFFEMLGNWSFGDYFRIDACRMAWELLTNVYKIPTSRLYVTYFKGDESLGISEDVETKNIWKELGVHESRILPFGTNDNFWEMGLIGPCGPCTEIHFDHITSKNRSEFVNKGLHDLVEVWNIVFIEYYRNIDRTITPLPKQHVDTGMGFERLTSVLQGKISNYDTDIFNYLMKAIHKNCIHLPEYKGLFGESDWNHLDQNYRTLADHTRMCTVCLADGVIPEENQKFRRILRKTFVLSETVFKKEKGLLKELSNYVVENLGLVYPELEKNISQVHQMIDYEEEVYRNLRESVSKDWQKLLEENPKLHALDIIESPSYINAYKEIKSTNAKAVDAELAFKLYDTYGLDEDGIQKIANALDLEYDPEALEKKLDQAKLKSKQGSLKIETKIHKLLAKNEIGKTNDNFKYSYVKNNEEYLFKDVECKVLRIFQNDSPVKEVDSDFYCCLLLDKTNLYSEAGGQISDKGTIKFGKDRFDVTSLENVNGYILHKGFFQSKNNKLKLNMVGSLSVNREFRMDCMKNHTGTHLLNAALKKFKGATCQKSSKVTNKYLKFDAAIFSEKLTIEEVKKIDATISDVIKSKTPVKVKFVNSQQLLDFDKITLIPGEIYPENDIKVIEIQNDKLLSREPCCGTHVLNTGDIGDFCITSVKSLSRSTSAITAVTGDRAKLARASGAELLDEIHAVKTYVSDNIDKPELLEVAISTLKKQLNFGIEDENVLPLSVKQECSEKLDRMSKDIKDVMKENLRDFIEIEMKSALNSNIKRTKSNNKYIVHYLRSSTMLDNVPLQKATKLCPDLPILVISFADNTVKARCCVPKNYKNDHFNAEKWLKLTVADVFKSKAAPPKGQDGAVVCNMKAKKIHVQEWDTLLKDSIEKANRYADDNL
ncbi:unnamed protein product [Acanthoscelides obtectus]|uniref:Alanine--tRNA ligase n=1 Tax=Acanthoscelides obtectus TaxID=200917 RepID=A0A9P0KBE5_ACAOB|nr:unnamed protein product [Acanthoscelides obtectus]CAK1645443.1 Alanine--tRNA ligase, mitochondrial [Acanthoscelides obtectus]